MGTDAESLVWSCGSPIVAVTRDGTIATANPAALALLGDLPERVVPEAWVAYFGLRLPDAATSFPVAELPLIRALAGATACADMWIRGHHVAMVAAPWPAGDGAVIVLHATDSYQQTARFLDTIIEHAPVMIFVKEATELRFLRFNREGKQLLGLDPGVNLIGKTDHDLAPRAQADFFVAKDREVLAARVVVEIPEEPIDTAHGRRYLHTRKVPILGDDGAPKWLVGISLDITERRAADDALRQVHDELEARVAARTAELHRSEAQLRQAQKMEAVGRLAGGVAHDFNNMLTAIMTHAQLLERDPQIGAHVRAGLSQIVEAGERAAALTHKLLAFSRQQVLQPEPLDLGVIATGMQPMLQRLIGEDIALRLAIAPELRAVVADPVQMEQVVLNLVVNARDAMPRGGTLTVEIATVTIRERLSATGDIAPGDYVRLAVLDTGVGMGPDTLARLFEPFFTTKPIGSGTGLGLSTTLGIVQQSGGEIVVGSTPGDGSTFAVYLPVAAGAATIQRRRKLTPIEVGAGTILLVEDEDLVRRAMHEILESAGYQVLAAATPAAALELCANHTGRIDLLVTDMVMPGMRGRELAIRARERLPHLVVLFVSGYTGESVAAADGAFLAKPFTPDALTAKVRGLIKK